MVPVFTYDYLEYLHEQIQAYHDILASSFITKKRKNKRNSDAEFLVLQVSKDLCLKFRLKDIT